MRTYILNATGADISPATIIICVVIAAICIFAVISYRKRLKNGCCGGGGDEVKHVKPQDTNVNDYDHVYRLDIEGMHCKNCAMHIENAFNEQPDCMAKVDLAGKFVRIYTKKPVEEVVLKQTVWHAGYEPKTVTVEK